MVRVQQRSTTEWRRTMQAGEVRRTHVLIEDPEAVVFDDYARFRAHGFETAVCTGPSCGACPLLHGASCRLLDEADILLTTIDLRDPNSRSVLRTIRSRHPEVPVVVRVAGRVAQHGFGKDELLDGCEVIVPGAGFIDQVGALRRALARWSDAWGMAVG